MEFCLLGPLEVLDDGGRQLDLGRPLQRALLAMLLLQRGRVVSMAAIIDGLWGENPPASADNSVQGYASRLRKALGSGVQVERTGSGYRLAVAPDLVDVYRLERLASEGRSALARGEATLAADALGRALALQRGAALAEFAERPFAAGDAQRIRLLVRAVEDDLVDARLALGHHDELLTIVECLVDDDPLSERRWGQLMTALYRAGRQADALEAFSAPVGYWWESWASSRDPNCAASSPMC